MVLLGVVVVAVACASFMGHATDVLGLAAAALLTVVAEELARTVMRYWLRTV